MRMWQSRLTSIFMSIWLSVTLAACGGVGGTTTADGGIGGTGVISAYGSIWVNGRHLLIDDAEILVKGMRMPGMMDGDEHRGLRIGMVVDYQATPNADGTYTATYVSYDDEMEGVVQENRVATEGVLIVMGQTVDVSDVVADMANRYEDETGTFAALADIPQGAVVEVSGFADGTGRIKATRIEVTDDNWMPGPGGGDGEVDIKGVVANLDPDGKTFTIGMLTVDYSNASVPVGLSNGLYVEVKSDRGIEMGNGMNATMIASEISLENEGGHGVGGEAGDEVELEGWVTQAYANGRVEVNGQTVLVDAGDMKGGRAPADLIEGVEVSVSGVLTAGGMVDAREVEIKDSGEEGDDD